MTLDGNRLSLAYKNLNEIHPRIHERYGNITDLDLSNNRFKDGSSLRGFKKIEILVLDNNLIDSHSKFPRMETVHTFWVNRNNITNLSVFLDIVVDSFPNLKYLSMLNNDACPNYFNGGTLKQYNDYRYYVISRLRNLSQLDSTPITSEERKIALELYGDLKNSINYEEKERERELRAKEEKTRQQDLIDIKKKKEDRARRKREKKELLRKKREEERKRKREMIKKKTLAKQELEEDNPIIKKSNKNNNKSNNNSGSDSNPADLLPEVEDVKEIIEEVADILPTVLSNSKVNPAIAPPSIQDLEDFEDLTDDDDWSDDDEDDFDFDIQDLSLDPINKSNNNNNNDDLDDDFGEWDE
eukprot:TRINITY_DN12699_c0_g1_i1.p1 TRINITY_DN12699_c0_g1~~TRINITY_DN12699_c0_g1_i1.p1  ORF type:complete len:356 (-),score=134.38 TRINITY_DN12699_c0_g1_i1:50-1117(-)